MDNDEKIELLNKLATTFTDEELDEIVCDINCHDITCKECPFNNRYC